MCKYEFARSSKSFALQYWFGCALLLNKWSQVWIQIFDVRKHRITARFLFSLWSSVELLNIGLWRRRIVFDKAINLLRAFWKIDSGKLFKLSQICFSFIKPHWEDLQLFLSGFSSLQIFIYHLNWFAGKFNLFYDH